MMTLFLPGMQQAYSSLALFLGLLALGGHLSAVIAAGFEERLLSPAYHGEGAQFGDLNRDGQPDLVSGPYWFEGPEFHTRNTYYLLDPSRRERKCL